MIINLSKINFSGCSGGGGDSKVISTKDFSITANGTTNITMDQDVDGISAGTITTNVQPTLTAATFDQNGTYTPVSADGFSSVTVAVDGSENRLNKLLTNHLTAVTQSDLSGVVGIRDYQFYGLSNLKSVDLPSSVTTLYQYSFRQSGVESLDISKITTLGAGVFQDCTSLTGVTGFESYTSNLPASMFNGCTALTGELTTRATNLAISNVFRNCFGLTGFTFLENVTQFPTATYMKPFEGCTSATHVDLTHNYIVPPLGDANLFTAFTQNYEIWVPQILYDSWTGTSQWSSANIVGHIVGKPNVYNLMTFKYTTNTGSAVTPGKAYTAWTGASIVSSEFDASTGFTGTFYGPGLSVGQSAFYNNSGLTSVEFGEGIVKIEGNAFYNNTSLTSVTFADSVQRIDENAFYGCPITSIDIPSGATIGSKNGTGAFQNTPLTSVTLTDVTLGFQTFAGCQQLKEVYLYGNTGPLSGATSQFSNISAATVVVIETNDTGVTWLAQSGLLGSASLTAVTFGSSLQFMVYENGYLFNRNAVISSITFESTTPPTINDIYASRPTFYYGIASSGTMYVPADSMSAYTTWAETANANFSNWTIEAIDECAGDPECECTEAGGVWDGEECQPAPEDCGGDPECECNSTGGFWDPDNQECTYPEPEE